MRVPHPTDQKLGSRGSHRCADIQQIELRIEARDHPGTDMSAFLERYPTPGFISRLSRPGNQPTTPQLLPCSRVVRHDDTGVRPTFRRTATPRDNLSVGDNRSRGLVGRMNRVIENLGLPHQIAGRGIESKHVVVSTRIDNQIIVDRQIAIRIDQAPDHVIGQIIGAITSILPQQVTSNRVNRLNHVPWIRHVHHALVHERGPLLQTPIAQRPCPHHAQITDVVSRNLVERAVSPPIESATPHQPVFRCRILQRDIRHWNERVSPLGSGAVDAKHQNHPGQRKNQA